MRRFLLLAPLVLGCNSLNGVSDLTLCADECSDAMVADAPPVDAPLADSTTNDAADTPSEDAPSNDVQSADTQTTDVPGADASGIPDVSTIEAATDTGQQDAGGADTGIVNNYAFVTSTTHAAPLGQNAADTICKLRAAEGGIPGEYVALLGSGESLASVLGSARGWVRRDGKPFADTIADLAAGRILHPLALTEISSSGFQFAWTGMLASGTADSDHNCNNFTSNMPSVDAHLGNVNGGPGAWISGERINSCNTQVAFMCFGISRTAPLVAPKSVGKLAFVSSVALAGNAGLSAFDARCKSDAAEAGLTGSFAAFVGATEVAATERMADTDYVRPDGQRVMSKSGILTGLVTGIWQTAKGAYVGSASERVFTGAKLPTLRASAGENCNSFTSTTDTAIVGMLSLLPDAWSSDTGLSYVTVPCSTPRRIYCVEQ